MGYIDIGLIHQVGRPQSGIYMITNVGFLKFATLENSNDEAGVAGVYPLLSGSYVCNSIILHYVDSAT